MQRQHLTAVAFVSLILLVGASIYFMEPAVPHPETGLADTPQVVDCTGDGACTRTSINTTITGCNEWYPSMPMDALTCNRTTAGVDAVTYIPDAANHIASAFTDTNYSTELRTPGLRKPWDIEFLPDGSALITQKSGELYRLDGGRLTQIATFDVVDDTLAGLMGLAVDPAFEDNGRIYLQYTYAYNNSYDRDDYYLKNRVSRFTLQGNDLSGETVLLDGIPGNLYHNGGRLEFGPDDKLYVTTGDAGHPAKSQDTGFLGGKILRMNTDGTVPGDNPFPDSYAYTIGHRNPQGVAWHPETGVAYATEHGPWRYDELNRLEAGGNYGWGTVKCSTPLGDHVEFTAPGQDTDDSGDSPQGTDSTDWIPPQRCFDSWTLAPSGMTFVDDPEHPWYGDLFSAGLRGRHVRRFPVAANGSVMRGEIFFANTENPRENGLGRRLRDVEFHDGALWVLGDWSGIAVLRPQPSS